MVTNPPSPPYQGGVVRTRIAPSPTGNLHVGTARAALFNELFARKHGGQFVVRIEDTDQERSSAAFEQNIVEGLAWLGLQWDEGPDAEGELGPYRQSERRETYRAAIEQLLADGSAYQEEGSVAVKLRVEPHEVVFTDLIRGEVRVASDTWGGDFVIARALDDPVYHLAHVIDDVAMQISHVIRGEDHLTNTARHILLYQALGYALPQFAHLPLLLDEARRKLSKRAGDTDLLAFRERGFLPEAMLNYLALLGWNPKDDQEFFSHDELIERFSLDGVQKGGAIFSETKLVAVNKQHLKQLSPAEVLEHARTLLEAASYELDDPAYWARAVATEQERVGTLAELPEVLTFFKSDWVADYPAELLVWKKSDRSTTEQLLGQLITKLRDIAEATWQEEHVSHELLTWIDAQELGRGDTLWPMRVALTGREHSPGPFEVAAVLGKELVVQRLEKAREKVVALGG